MWCMRATDSAFTGALRRSSRTRSSRITSRSSTRDGGNLYLPATRLEGIQKYAGSDAKTPKLNKLGGEEWNKTKTQGARRRSRRLRRIWCELYAARQRSEGYQYGPDTVWQREFEEMFPFEETEDQLDGHRSDQAGHGKPPASWTA